MAVSLKPRVPQGKGHSLYDYYTVVYVWESKKEEKKANK